MTKTQILNDIITSNLFSSEVKAYATAWLKDIKPLSAYATECEALSSVIIPAVYINGKEYATVTEIANTLKVTTEKATDMCAVLVANDKLSLNGDTYSLVKESGYDAATEALAGVVIPAVYVNGRTVATIEEIASIMHLTVEKAQILCDINVSKGTLVKTGVAYKLA